MTLKTTQHAAMKLPASDRGRLAAALLSTLEKDDSFGLERAWIEEVDRRYSAYRSGHTNATPAKQTLAAARAALRR